MKIRLSDLTILWLLPVTIVLAQKGTRNPHGPLRWECMACHSTQSWRELRQPLAFNHARTGYPLLGAHQSGDCMSCHRQLIFSQVSRACADCHTDVHRDQFGNDCQNCHTPENWDNQQNILDLHSSRGFPLLGLHAVVDCQACHIQEQQNEFTGLPTACFNCHVREYRNTVSPSHSAFRFPEDCRQCHHAIRWEGAVFDHLQVSGFELQGAHASLACIDCHDNNRVNGLPRECIGCHQNDFVSVSDPNHLDNNFPTDCLLCHNQESWSAAAFDHNLTAFPLTGAHLLAGCSDCHINNRYAGTPVECYSCHQQDYDNTGNPNHMAAGFPTECQFCHNTSGWGETSWDHDAQFFPIYSGAHRGKWDDCSDCHVNPGTFAVFECIFCHAHSQPEMDDKHKNLDQYVYASGACYGCHPAGRGLFGVPRFLDRHR